MPFITPDVYPKEKINKLDKYIEETKITDEMKKKRIVTCDPGLSDIFYAISKNIKEKIIIDKDDKLKVVNEEELLTFRYTQDQRRLETRNKKYNKLQDKINKDTKINNKTIKEIETEMSKYNSKTVDFFKFIEYCKKKNEVNRLLFNHYKEDVFRKLKFNRYTNTQKSESKMIMNFSNKFGKEFGIKEEIHPAKSVMFAYVFISIADLGIGLLSQALKSRKKALYIFYALTIASIVLYFRQYNGTANQMYALCAFAGFATGFWAIFVTMAAEHFGTNLRATATTTVPNMVRGALPLMIILFEKLQQSFSYIVAAEITGAIVMIISTTAAIMTEETFGKDLNFLEE
jgi:hypothetical protein